MAELRFRVYFNNTAATAEDLAHIEEIHVEQAENAAWEARCVMALCLNAQGNWDRQGDIRLRPRTQVRVELQIGARPFRPLIEGPIVGVDTAMDARPGRSSATFTIHDNSAWLNLESRSTILENQPHDAIVRQLFTELPPGAAISPFQPDISIPNGGQSPPSLGEQFAQLGTPMQKLRELARRNGCHVYVLPAPEKGQPSIGCFKGDPEGNPSLPPLVVLGASRNLLDVTATEDPESSAFTTVHSLSLGNQQVTNYTTQQSDQTLLGPRPAAPAPAGRRAPAGVTEDPRAAAAARDRLRNYPVKFNGRLIPGAYPTILQPYQRVALQAGAAATSSILLITKVTHRMTPSRYTVEFEGRGNSLSDLQSVANLPINIV